jgi:hypothetical protein
MKMGQPYRLLRGSHGRVEGDEGLNKRYRPGDVIDLSADEAAQMGSRVEAMKAEEDWSGVLASPVGTVRQVLRDLDDPDAVRSLRDAEIESGGRKSVIAAAESRLAHLVGKEE